MHTQLSKAELFKHLHERAGIFVVPNPWDAGAAKLLQHLGFEALATTSAGFALTLGKPDGEGALARSETLENVRAIVQATTLPVSVDMENGYADDPIVCAESISLVADAGAVGCSIEDSTGIADRPIYPFGLAVARIKEAVVAARKLTFPFTLTARAENLIHGIPDLKDTIKRLEAFADAGADVLFAPGLKTREEMITVVKAISPRPLSVVMGLSSCSLTLNDLQEIGVKRVSLGSSLARAAYSALLTSATEILKVKTFTFSDNITSYAEINRIFHRK